MTILEIKRVKENNIIKNKKENNIIKNKVELNQDIKIDILSNYIVAPILWVLFIFGILFIIVLSILYYLL